MILLYILFQYLRMLAGADTGRFGCAGILILGTSNLDTQITCFAKSIVLLF